MTIEDYLKLLRDTPLPSILVIGGIIFLLLSVLQKAGTSVETKPGRERFAIFTGVVLLLSGISLYLVPPASATPTSTEISTLTANAPVAVSTEVPFTTQRASDTATPTILSPSTSAPTVKPLPTIIDVDALLPYITKGHGGIQKAILWWNELSYGGENGERDPSTPPGWAGCFGIAWNTTDFYRTVIVFQQKRVLKFAPGGWYVQICAPDNVQITPDDIGRIQADWLSKEYGGTWAVQVFP